MSNKRFSVSRTEAVLYDVWAKNKKEAISMVKNGNFRPVGSSQQEGFVKVYLPNPLVVWDATNYPAPTVKGENGATK